MGNFREPVALLCGYIGQTIQFWVVVMDPAERSIRRPGQTGVAEVKTDCSIVFITDPSKPWDRCILCA